MALKMVHSWHFIVKYHARIVTAYIKFTWHCISCSYFLNSVPIVEYQPQMKFTLPVTFTFKYVPSRCLGLYHGIQEIRAKFL